MQSTVWSADDVQMTSPRADVSKRNWRVTVREEYWPHVKARASNAENSSGAWRRVEGPMKAIFHKEADRRDYFSMVQSVV